MVKRGVRAGSRSVVLHALERDDADPVRVGFVVSAAVGNAVTRNRVKRQLRHLVVERLPALGAATSVVVRARADAATQAAPELARDLDGALQALAERRSPR